MGGKLSERVLGAGTTALLLAGLACQMKPSLEDRRAAAAEAIAEIEARRARSAATQPEPPPQPDPATTGFETFELVANEEPCPAQAKGDCQGTVFLQHDGMLTMDPWGLPQLPAFEARVAPEALANVIPALTDPALLELMGRKPVCKGANASEQMGVSMGGQKFVATTGHCNQEPIQAVRAALMSLTDAHFGGRSWFSPPF